MNDPRIDSWRRAVRRGDLPEDLVQVLRGVAVGMARRRVLPPSFAPYGTWDDEAAAEIFAAWYADRLLGAGQLLALLDRSSSTAGLQSLAARSLRQHLLNVADRSQARNLFARVVQLMQEGERFSLVQSASRAAETWYALVPPNGEGHEASLWAGADRELIAHGWALGDHTVVRYRASALKLSPVLAADELERFVAGLMARARTALTPNLVMRVLSARFDLGDTALHQSIEESPLLPSPALAPDAQVRLTQTAQAILDDLSGRQREVLRRFDDAVAAIAETLGCSVGTVVNERRRIGQAVARLSEDDEDRDALLNLAADLLYDVADE